MSVNSSLLNMSKDRLTADTKKIINNENYRAILASDEFNRLYAKEYFRASLENKFDGLKQSLLDNPGHIRQIARGRVAILHLDVHLLTSHLDRIFDGVPPGV